MKKFKKSEQALISFAVFVFAIATYVSISNIPVWQLLLVKDWSNFSWNQFANQSTPIGKISLLNGEGISRKYKQQTMFKGIRLESELFLGDTIRTDDKTMATISLNTGEEISLGNNSMVILSFDSSDPLSGLITKPKIKVVPTHVQEKVEPKIVEVKLEEKLSKIKVETIKPKRVVAEVKPNKLKTLFTEEKVTLPPPPVVEKVEPKVIQPTPTPVPEEKKVVPPQVVEKPKPKLEEVVQPLVLDSFLSMPGGAELHDNKLRDRQLDKFFILLKWRPVAKATDYKIQVFNALNDLILEDRAIDPSYKLYENKVYDGDIYYQVIAYQGHKVLGKTEMKKKSFSFLPPEPKMPINTTVDKQPIMFTWTKTNFTENYVFEVAQDESFKRKIQKTNKENFIQLNLKPGRYFWRIRSISGEVISPPSKTVIFEIK